MADPIKVVFTTFSYGGGNGIARMESALARALDPERFDVTIAYTRVNPGPAPEMSAPYVNVPVTGRFDELLKLYRDADVVQVSSPFDPVAFEAALASGVPAVVEAIHNFTTGRLYPETDASVCVSSAILRLQPDPTSAVVIHNGIDLPCFPFARPRENFDSVTLLEVGRHNKRMHYHLDELAPDLIGLASGVKLQLCGPGQTQENTAHIEYLGLVEDMSRVYAGADLLVLLSKKEAFGLVAAEAMASGCLPIVSDDGGMTEVVTHGQTGWLVDAGDKQAVICAIRQAMDILGTPKWRTMREAARKSAEERFSMTACAQAYENLYLDILNSKGRRAEPGPVEAPHPPEVDLATASYLLTTKAPINDIVTQLLAMADNPVPLTRALSHQDWENSIGLAITICKSATSMGMPMVAKKILGKLAHSELMQ